MKVIEFRIFYAQLVDAVLLEYLFQKHYGPYRAADRRAFFDKLDYRVGHDIAHRRITRDYRLELRDGRYQKARVLTQEHRDAIRGFLEQYGHGDWNAWFNYEYRTLDHAMRSAEDFLPRHAVRMMRRELK